MRKPRAKLTPYAIYYKDGTYMTYDLTKDDYEALTGAIVERKPVALSVGFIVIDDIRAVILQKPTPAPVPDKPAVPDLPPDEREWLKTALAGIYDEEVQ